MDPRIRRPLFQRTDQHGHPDRGVGELARVMARKYGDQSFKAGEKENLADEMADVLWVLVCLANQTGVNLTEALEANFAKKTARDKERHRNNPKL